MDRDADYQDLELGPLLRRLRRGVSLREVQRLAGVSYAHLSLIERGDRIPGPRILKRLAALYGIGAHDLLKRAGYLESEGEGPRPDETLEVEAGLPVRPGRSQTPPLHPALGTPPSGHQAFHRRDV